MYRYRCKVVRVVDGDTVDVDRSKRSGGFKFHLYELIDTLEILDFPG